MASKKATREREERSLRERKKVRDMIEVDRKKRNKRKKNVRDREG